MNQEGNFGTAKGQEGEEMEKNFYYWELEIKESTGKQNIGIDLK